MAGSDEGVRMDEIAELKAELRRVTEYCERQIGMCVQVTLALQGERDALAVALLSLYELLPDIRSKSLLAFQKRVAELEGQPNLPAQEAGQRVVLEKLISALEQMASPKSAH